MTAAVTKLTAVFYALLWGKPHLRQKGALWNFLTLLSTYYRPFVIALGAGLGIWGVINLLEGYGNDNPGAKSQGIKQLMAGGGVALIGTILVPLLSGLFG